MAHKEIAVREAWRELCASRGLDASQQDLRRLAEVAEGFGMARLLWGLRSYAEEASLPNLRDFEDWLKQQKDLPDEVVCTAYLLGDPEITTLADRLETLRAAWFPSEETAREIQELEERLKGLMC